ncbi:uncharacterized protein LAESUDRAFT_815467 [Laetiporus sulphureus 93-53]|uniref:Uncharacterized protein n=1 Tax=Laetiporus sulphureus 93-53 TaxID=1314785 RepID=A0A165C679_9APHY|nr:uncharacterized protein LAESUDRAFT_815467 [Laetiporus sulphureus 93-53]KZT02274.1 hypothetical protein LAESUDRAFT_815467 [Laetiporus sulphureus 93-53]
MRERRDPRILASKRPSTFAVQVNLPAISGVARTLPSLHALECAPSRTRAIDAGRVRGVSPSPASLLGRALDLLRRSSDSFLRIGALGKQPMRGAPNQRSTRSRQVRGLGIIVRASFHPSWKGHSLAPDLRSPERALGARALHHNHIASSHHLSSAVRDFIKESW